MSAIHYSQCPVCGSPDIKNVLQVKDHMVSHETFAVAECGNCSLRFTQDVPDANAIGPYYKSEDYISHTNASHGFINRLYQAVSKRSMTRKKQLIIRSTGLSKGSVLDVGSGIGRFVREMRSSGWQATGLEPDEGARKTAKQLYDIDLKEAGELYRLSPDSFDAITLWHVLEHVHDLGAYMQQLKKLLKEKGRLFIAVPNYTSKDESKYKEYWAAYDVPRHLYHFSPRSMEVLMERNGLKVQQYKPMWYDSFYISLLSCKYKNGKTRLLPAFWNGLRSDLVAMNNIKKCSSLIYIISK